MSNSDPATALLLEAATGPRQTKWDTFRELQRMGEEAVPAVLEGMSHPDWRVRRASAIFVDHEPVPELMQRLRLALHDPKAKVRRWAVHSLSCEPCKPGGNPVDAIPLIIQRLRDDKAPKVRRMAVLMLMTQVREPRIVRAIRKAHATDPDAKVRGYAGWWLRRQGLLRDPGAAES